MVKAGIIGRGLIGSELYKRLIKKKWDVVGVANRSGFSKNSSATGAVIPIAVRYDTPSEVMDAFFKEDVDVMFLAIPTLDDGQIAQEYIKDSISAGIPIVTCEKGALGNYFNEVFNPEMLGYSAAVGGGTRLLRYARTQCGGQVEEIHAVVNGTLNYIFEGLSNGRSLGEVVDETIGLGYAEPGTENPLDVLNKEAVGDVPMKAAILYNVCGLTENKIRAKDVERKELSDKDLSSLVREAKKRRYIVSFTRDGRVEDVIGGFKCQIGEWRISAGFKNIDENPLYHSLMPEGVNNALLISEGRYGKDGHYKVSGPGAGAAPTASAMIKDAVDLLK
ncbi:MAG: hypothetical protein Q8Q01_05155 [archaeon]|nr:hypothetical protein [archaeon]